MLFAVGHTFFTAGLAEASARPENTEVHHDSAPHAHDDSSVFCPSDLHTLSWSRTQGDSGDDADTLVFDCALSFVESYTPNLRERALGVYRETPPQLLPFQRKTVLNI